MRAALLLAALTLTLAGCSGFTGSPHGYAGSADSPWVDMSAIPTIVPDGGSPMGYRLGADGSEEDMYTSYDDGVIKATGRAAYALGLARLCGVAPRAPACGAPIE